MNFLLKIVEGPNKGAEVALVEGVAVTLGKGDDCDIVLADPTMPDEPLPLQATADGVTAGGAALEPLHVMTIGATSIAVGPADAPWGELVWPGKEPAKPEGEEAEGDRPEDGGGESQKSEEGADEVSDKEKPATQRRHGCLGCLVVLLVAVLALCALAWFHRKKSKEVCKIGYAKIRETCSGWGLKWEFLEEKPAETAEVAEKPSLDLVAARYDVELTEEGGVAKLAGNFKTRRERLAATAEAYAVQPGVELDFSDDESLRASAEDALFTLTEGALRLSAATNRFLKIVGRSPSAAALKKTLKALDADMPKLNGVDVTGVAFGHVPGSHGSAESAAGGLYQRTKDAKAKKHDATPSLPVCGILTTPYPCLITRDGRRYHEGAALGDSVIVKIGADSVVLTNSTGRFTWKP